MSTKEEVQNPDTEAQMKAENQTENKEQPVDSELVDNTEATSENAEMEARIAQLEEELKQEKLKAIPLWQEFNYKYSHHNSEEALKKAVEEYFPESNSKS